MRIVVNKKTNLWHCWGFLNKKKCANWIEAKNQLIKAKNLFSSFDRADWASCRYSLLSAQICYSNTHSSRCDFSPFFSFSFALRQFLLLSSFIWLMLFMWKLHLVLFFIRRLCVVLSSIMFVDWRQLGMCECRCLNCCTDQRWLAIVFRWRQWECESSTTTTNK